MPSAFSNPRAPRCNRNWPRASITIAEIDARLNGEGGEIRRVFALADQAAYSGQPLSTADFQRWKEMVFNQIQRTEAL
jgi:hypothetical protein